MTDTSCDHCGSSTMFPGGRVSRFGENLCDECNRAELRTLIQDLDPDEIKTIRRRVEDLIRKSPAALIEIAALLSSRGEIRIDDLI